MSGLPEVTIAGTVTADPELKFFDSGASVVNFTVAANDRRFDRDKGEWVDASSTFLRCSAWRQTAENVVESVSKGTRVLITGVLKQRSFETAEGDKRTVFELDTTEVAVSLKFATATPIKTTRSKAASASGPGPSTAPTAATSSTGSQFPGEPPF